jgi:tetratricopeptide (TPR) repeat protein
MRFAWLLASLLACGFAPTPLRAHDSPEHVVEALTAEMASKGVTAELLYRRAVEYRTLSKFAEAEADLTAAVGRDENFLPAKFELANVLARQKQWDRALSLVEPLTHSGSLPLRAAALAARGNVRYAQRDWLAAVRDLDAALRLEPNVDWFLLRAEVHRERNDAAARIAGLREALAKTESPVVLRNLCDALIDVGGDSLAEAVQIVDKELAESRLRAAWLMRRARIRLLQKNRPAAEADLRDAIAELDLRLNVLRPDPSLQIDRLVARYVLETPTASPDELRPDDLMPAARRPTQIAP